MNLQDLTSIYGAFQLAAVIAFLLLLHVALRRRGSGLAGHGWLASLAVLGAGAGGRLHYLIEGLAAGRIAPADVGAALSPAAGGSTFFGAMLGVGVVLVAVRRRLPGGSLARLADDAVPGIGLAILLGRFGCLAHGCCLGEPSGMPWALPAGLAFGPDAVLLHPLALYLGLWGLVSAAVAVALARRGGSRRSIVPASHGTRFVLFAALFALGRAGIESFRLAPPEDLAGGSWAGWESLLIAAAAIAALAVRYRPRGIRSSTSPRAAARPKRPDLVGSHMVRWIGEDWDGLRPLE